MRFESGRKKLRRLSHALARLAEAAPRRVARSRAFALVLALVPMTAAGYGVLELVQAHGILQGEHAVGLYLLAAAFLLEAAFTGLLFWLSRRKERELASWILLEGERQRYHNVGEVSGLMVHDLSSHMMLINFGLQILRQRPEKVHDAKFLDGLFSGAAGAEDLMNSLKSYLKGQAQGGQGVKLGDCLDYIQNLLRFRFYEKMDMIRVKADPRLRNVVVALSKSNMIHILINLTANSVENLLKVKVAAPTLEVELDAQASSEDADYVVFTISDNGSGLSPEQFGKLTSSNPKDSDAGEGKSMGLRLIRRLIERETGSISIAESPRLGEGTTFRLKLPTSHGVVEIPPPPSPPGDQNSTEDLSWDDEPAA